MKEYFELLDQMIEIFSEGSFEEEVKMAKEEFVQNFGILSSEDFTKQESYLFLFRDWYLFYWKLGKTQKTPMEMTKEKSKFPLEARFQKPFENLFVSSHSLFALSKEKRKSFFFEDLFSGYKFEVLKDHFESFVVTDQIFEARLIPHESFYIFSNAFCFHPAEASSFILKEVKSKRKKEEELKYQLLYTLRKMRYQLDRYPHVGLNQVYSYESKLRF